MIEFTIEKREWTNAVKGLVKVQAKSKNVESTNYVIVKNDTSEGLRLQSLDGYMIKTVVLQCMDVKNDNKNDKNFFIPNALPVTGKPKSYLNITIDENYIKYTNISDNTSEIYKISTKKEPFDTDKVTSIDKPIECEFTINASFLSKLLSTYPKNAHITIRKYDGKSTPIILTENNSTDFAKHSGLILPILIR